MPIFQSDHSVIQSVSTFWLDHIFGCNPCYNTHVAGLKLLYNPRVMSQPSWFMVNSFCDVYRGAIVCHQVSLTLPSLLSSACLRFSYPGVYSLLQVSFLTCFWCVSPNLPRTLWIIPDFIRKRCCLPSWAMVYVRSKWGKSYRIQGLFKWNKRKIYMSAWLSISEIIWSI